MKLLFTILGLLFLNFTFTQVYILDETFDSGSIPSQWTIVDNDHLTPATEVQEYTQAWIYKEDPTIPGNGTASSTSYFTTPGRAERWLISPQLTLGAYGNYISWKGMSYDPSFPDSYRILISTTGNAIEDFKDTLTSVLLQTPYWAEYTESLDEFANQNIYVAFVNFTYDGYKLFLDSIRVRKEDPLAVQTEVLNVQLFPNPVVNNLNLYSNSLSINNVSISNNLGQLVLNKRFKNTPHSVQIAIGKLPAGIYYVTINTDKGIIRKKIVK